MSIKVGGSPPPPYATCLQWKYQWKTSTKIGCVCNQSFNQSINVLILLNTIKQQELNYIFKKYLSIFSRLSAACPRKSFI